MSAVLVIIMFLWAIYDWWVAGFRYNLLLAFALFATGLLLFEVWRLYIPALHATLDDWDPGVMPDAPWTMSWFVAGLGIVAASWEKWVRTCRLFFSRR